jgi:hypothetical protein
MVVQEKILPPLTRLDKKGVRFALSNVLEHKGDTNKIMKEWANKYKIHKLNYDYKNSNYHTTAKNNKTVWKQGGGGSYSVFHSPCRQEM